jgi:hypothetical protein
MGVTWGIYQVVMEQNHIVDFFEKDATEIDHNSSSSSQFSNVNSDVVVGKCWFLAIFIAAVKRDPPTILLPETIVVVPRLGY